jgi:hypothetical protein
MIFVVETGRPVVSVLPQVQPGDVVLVRGGVRDEAFIQNIPSGDSWDAPVTLRAYPGESVTFAPAAERVAYFVNQSFIELDGFTLDAGRCNSNAVKITHDGNDDHAAHHIRLRNVRCTNSKTQGCLVVVNRSTWCEFLGCRFDHNGIGTGDDKVHGLYLNSHDNLVEDCEFDHNAGWGLQVFGYEPARNVIRRVRSHDNAQLGRRGVGLGIYGPDNLIEDFQSWNNAIGVQIGSHRNRFRNGYVWANRDAAIDNQSPDAIIEASVRLFAPSTEPPPPPPDPGDPMATMADLSTDLDQLQAAVQSLVAQAQSRIAALQAQIGAGSGSLATQAQIDALSAQITAIRAIVNVTL